MISLAYFKDGHFETVEPYTGERHILDYDEVIKTFKSKIAAVESNPNPRIKEFIQRIQPTDGSLSTGYFSRQTKDGLWLIQYSFDPTRESWDYILPNSIEWKEFPEVNMAQSIVKQNLQTINSSDCSIPQEGFHSSTSGKQWGSEDRSWFMAVPLTCPDSIKDATLKINPDGSFERLAITWEAKTN